MVTEPDEPSLFMPASLPVAPLDERSRIACLRLIRSSNVGPVTFRELINHYGGAVAALDALPDLARRRMAAKSFRICPQDEAEAELAAAEKVGARPVFTVEPGYPAALAATDAPPPLLYVKGNVALLNAPCVAVIGSRQASAAGQKLARVMASELANAGFVVVSGLARGIDAAAHRAALAQGTIAVLGGGIDVVYPPEHIELQDEIAARGCLVSERPPGLVPRGKDFPRRNRIIAGLSLAVLVIEAARKSGTLFTARLAAEYGREVFAVPGHPLDPRAAGTNRLLKDGATLATDTEDVLQVLAPIAGRAPRGLRESPDPPAPVPMQPVRPPSQSESDAVLEVLGPHPVDIDEITRASELSVRDVRIILMELDLAGLIERHGSQLVSLRRLPTGEN